MRGGDSRIRQRAPPSPARPHRSAPAGPGVSRSTRRQRKPRQGDSQPEARPAAAATGCPGTPVDKAGRTDPRRAEPTLGEGRGVCRRARPPHEFRDGGWEADRTPRPELDRWPGPPRSPRAARGALGRRARRARSATHPKTAPIRHIELDVSAAYRSPGPFRYNSHASTSSAYLSGGIVSGPPHGSTITRRAMNALATTSPFDSGERAASSATGIASGPRSASATAVRMPNDGVHTSAGIAAGFRISRASLSASTAVSQSSLAMSSARSGKSPPIRPELPEEQDRDPERRWASACPAGSAAILALAIRMAAAHSPGAETSRRRSRGNVRRYRRRA